MNPTLPASVPRRGELEARVSSFVRTLRPALGRSAAMPARPPLRALLFVVLASGASAQRGIPTAPRDARPAAPVSAERDVTLDGRSIVGRWRAVEVVGDRAATRDLGRGTLTTVLAVNPTGHAILRGTDRREGGGAPAAFSGRIDGPRLRFRDLPGEAELSLVQGRLHLTDPRGRRTVFVRDR